MDFAGTNVLTFDVGGSHVSSGLCSIADLTLAASASAPLEDLPTFEGFVDLLFNLGHEVAGSQARLAGASLAVPGPFDCAAGVSLMQHKLHALYQRDLRGALTAKFGWEPNQLHFLNDAAAFLLGEVHAGAARGARRAVGLALGTGIGSAFAVDGRCLLEGEAVPPGGEIWNVPYAGGIVEDLISTRTVREGYQARTGKDLEVKEIAAAAPADADARAVFTTLGQHLGQVIRDIIVPFHPDVVVIGGGISRAGHLFLPAAHSELEGLGVRIVPCELLEHAALVGAGAFWRDQSARAAASPAHPTVA